MLRVLGPDHPYTLTTRRNLAYWRGQAGVPAFIDQPIPEQDRLPLECGEGPDWRILATCPEQWHDLVERLTLGTTVQHLLLDHAEVEARRTYFHGCYSVGDDTLWGINRRKKDAANTLAALRSIRAARPDGAPTYVILDDLSAHKGEQTRRWAKRNRVEPCLTPTFASWANPIEAHFGPLRQFTVANSNHRNHTVRSRPLHAYLRWRHKNARHPDVLAAQRRERARIR